MAAERTAAEALDLDALMSKEQYRLGSEPGEGHAA